MIEHKLNKMKKRVTVSFVALFLMMSNVFSQTLQDAIKQTTNEQYENADATFKKLIVTEPNSGEVYFYYGENFFKSDDLKNAQAMYQKGAEVAPDSPFPLIGLGKIQWVKGQTADAKVNFTKAIDMTRGKNANVLMQIADVYIHHEKKDLAEALVLLDKASILDSKNPQVYILLGDAYLEQNNNGSQAITNYEKAEELDKSSVTAILRQGQLYNRARNYNLALDLYKKASLIDSSFAPAYREKAEIYAMAGQYKNAVEQYQHYLEINNDCGARSRYAGFLFQAKEYALSVEAAKEAQKCAPNNAYLFRYLAYSQNELEDYQNSLKNSEAFFANLNPDISVIALDYEYMGKSQAKLGDDSLAIISFKKAMETDTSKDLTNDIATLYMKSKNFAKAAEVYKERVDEGNANINDIYGLGRAYYYAKDFVNADTTFGDMIAMRPDLGLSYLWKAKSSVQLDPKNETWQAKPYYELFIQKTTPEEVESNKANLINAHTYLAAYYAGQKDLENTKAQFQEVLNIDPENAQAKKFLEAASKSK